MTHDEDDHKSHKFFNRKEGKKERKIARKTDRSQYKKTDLEKKEAHRHKKIKEQITNANLVRGIVLSIQPEAILVEFENTLFTCVLKGLMKKEMRQEKNLVAVGDYVFFDPTNLSIYAIEERKSFLSKKATLHEKKEQYIACNIDYVLITASCLMPPLNLSLIDCYIIAARKGNMTPVIVINKVDLLKESSREKLLYEEALRIYKQLGFTILGVSAKTNEGIDALKKIMKDHSSVFAGESGVGKSSLINLITGLELPTKNITEKIWRGTHTTTSAKLIPLFFGGYCIDTPGIQKFGIWDLQREDLEIYFPEFSKLSCRYANCSHTHEPGCHIHQALEKGEVSPLRYESYLTLFKSIGKTH